MFYSSRKKVFILGIAVLSFLLSLGLFQFAERVKKEQNLSEKIESFGDEEFRLSLWDFSIDTKAEQTVEIDWWFREENETYYFFIPKVLSERLCYVFNQYEYVLIDGEEIRPGDSFHMQEGIHEISLVSGEIIPIEVMFSENINSMFIQTDLDDLTGIHESKGVEMLPLMAPKRNHTASACRIRQRFWIWELEKAGI